MIQHLRIKDLALLTEVTLEFDAGFTCITGETGAGKSILLGALAMLAGNRMDRSVIRHEQDQCEVEAAIYLPNPEGMNAALASLDLPPCEDQTLLLYRSLHQSKVPKIRINGTLSTLTNLSQIGEHWIDFHGPGEPQKLFKESFQLEILDLYAKTVSELGHYQSAFEEWVRIGAELEKLQSETQLSEDEIDYLTRQVAKIDELAIDRESLEELEANFQRASSAEELSQLLDQMRNHLFEDGSATDAFASALSTAHAIEQIDPTTASTWKRLESLAIELDDFKESLDELASTIELDDAAVHELKTRMEIWLELKRKYGKTPEQVLHARNDMAHKLQTHSDIGATLKRLEEQQQTALETVISRGRELTEKRRLGAEKLNEKVVENLHELGFKKALFEIEVIEESSPRANGTSRCRMMFAPNPGQPMQPLNKIASSGETARVMLGVKAELAKFDQTPVLVFDEVDANVGGEIGKSVGRMIAKLARNHQIFCVTHLPQVAAQGQEHYLVEKSQTDTATDVAIRQLQKDGDERVCELARMLGDRNSESALTHARELLGEQELIAL
jgi:DNA repair protein RecN (Recombination protein N)